MTFSAVRKSPTEYEKAVINMNKHMFIVHCYKRNPNHKFGESCMKYNRTYHWTYAQFRDATNNFADTENYVFLFRSSTNLDRVRRMTDDEFRRYTSDFNHDFMADHVYECDFYDWFDERIGFVG